MKTTLDIPTELYRQAKVKAALEGRKIKDLVSEGLALVIRGERLEPGAHENSTSYAVSRSPAKGHDGKQPIPAWYGVLSAYAKQGPGGSDMKSIRDSIARGLAKERRL